MSGDIIKVNGVCVLKAKGLCHRDESIRRTIKKRKYEMKKRTKTERKENTKKGVTFRIRNIFPSKDIFFCVNVSISIVDKIIQSISIAQRCYLKKAVSLLLNTITQTTFPHTLLGVLFIQFSST